MGWFSKKNKKEDEEEIPQLHELPNLPELDEKIEGDSLPQLPSLPNSSFGEKLSQTAIKEAVSGQKEDVEGLGADEFEIPEQRIQKMPKPLSTMRIPEPPKFKTKKRLTREIPVSLEREIRLTREIPERSPLQFIEEQKTRKVEPVFIRIDKFRESLQIFEGTKRKIVEIEKILKDIKKIKEEEENELNLWEDEIQIVKTQMDKIDKDIFSKLE